MCVFFDGSHSDHIANWGFGEGGIQPPSFLLTSHDFFMKACAVLEEMLEGVTDECWSTWKISLTLFTLVVSLRLAALPPLF